MRTSNNKSSAKILVLGESILQLKKKPYHLLLLTSILLFTAGLSAFKTAMDIHFHDTYYVFPLAYLIWALSVISGIFWLLYLTTKEILFSKGLSWIHIILTIAACIFILTMRWFMTDSYLAGMPRHYYDIGQSETSKIHGHLTQTD